MCVLRSLSNHSSFFSVQIVRILGEKSRFGSKQGSQQRTQRKRTVLHHCFYSGIVQIAQTVKPLGFKLYSSLREHKFVGSCLIYRHSIKCSFI
jgi:hypothetical protein